MNKIQYYNSFILRTSITIVVICLGLVGLVIVGYSKLETYILNAGIGNFTLVTIGLLGLTLWLKIKLDHKIVIEKRKWLAEVKYFLGMILNIIFISILGINAFILPQFQDVYNSQTVFNIVVQISTVIIYIYCGIVVGALIFLLFFQITYPYTRKVASETSGVLISLLPVTVAYIGYIIYIYYSNGGNFAFMSEYLLFVILTFLTNLLIVFYYLKYYDDKIRDEKLNSSILRIIFANKMFTNLLLLPINLIAYIGNFVKVIFLK